MVQDTDEHLVTCLPGNTHRTNVSQRANWGIIDFFCVISGVENEFTLNNNFSRLGLLPLNDRDLLQRIANGDGDAWNLLYERHISTLWRYVAARMGSGNIHAAEDIVSEVMLTLARKPPDIDKSEGTLASWLLGVARNKVADHFRQKQSRKNLAVYWSEHHSHLDSVEQHDSSVEFALNQLSNDATLVLLWKYADGMSVREIATRLGKTEKAVESMLFRARNSFKAAYRHLDTSNPTSTRSD